jgi:hypothetical protein
MSTLSGKNNFIENILEKAGAIHTLQSFRKIAGYSSHGNFATNLVNFLQTEEFLREYWQFEISFKNKIKKERENNHGTSNEVIEQLKLGLEEMHKAYWVTEKLWWEMRKSFRPGPFFRGFELWRSNPRWYLHRAPREDCAGKGGCCGRSCGCCLKRRGRPLGVGHCTKMCDCCERASGFNPFDDEEVNEQDEEIELLELIHKKRCENKSDYTRRLGMIMMLGLEPGTRQNPFELIDERLQVKLPFGSLDPPPGYT